jgi:hypothetical protein
MLCGYDISICVLYGAALEVSNSTTTLHMSLSALYMDVITIPSGSIQAEFEFEMPYLLVEHQLIIRGLDVYTLHHISELVPL